MNAETSNPIGSRGTGTWNDESYQTLLAVESGTEPNILKEKRRDHMRAEIDEARFEEYRKCFAAKPPNRDLAKMLPEDLKSKPGDTNAHLDKRIKKIADDFAASGASDWNISIGIDRRNATGSPYFVEVTLSDVYHDPVNSASAAAPNTQSGAASVASHASGKTLGRKSRRR